MDSKCQKKRRQSKKSKKITSDKNTNVLVVPPDILKKLGINIGSVQATIPAQQIGDNVNAVQSSEIANNSAQADILTPSYANEENVSSIQETATLMKKSVFLSPTFIDTIANIIPGEVEFSNNKSFTELKINKRLPVENRYETNDINKPNYNHSTIQFDIMTNDLASVPTVYENIKRDEIIIENVNVINDQPVPELPASINQDYISVQEDRQTSEKVSLHHPENNENEYITIATEQIELLNNLVSTQEHTQTHNKDLTLDEEINKNVTPMNILDEPKAMSDDSKAIVVEYCELDNNVIALEENITANTVSEIEDLNSLQSYSQTFPVQIEPVEDTSKIIHVKGNIHFNETENMSNLISTEGCLVQIQLAEFDANRVYGNDAMTVTVDANIDSNLIPMEGSAFQIDQVKGENNLVSSKELLDEITVTEIENNVTPLKELIHSNETSYINISLEHTVQAEQAMTKSNDVSPNEINLEAGNTGTQNIMTIVDNINDNNESENSIVNSPDIFEKPLLHEKSETILNKIVDSNNVVSNELHIISNDKLNCGKIKSLMEQDSNVLQLRQQQQSAEMKSEIVTAMKKEKLCIISQEIIISSNSNEYRTSQFPITNTINHEDISVDSTDKQSSVSSLFNSDTLIADTPNSVEVVPSISKEVGTSIKNNIFSVPSQTIEIFGNALHTNNNINHNMNKNTLCCASEDKIASNNKKTEKLSENRNFIENNVDSNMLVQQEHTTKKMDVSKDEELYEEELNKILKSTKENNNAITQGDKVKEIANCIKKFSHLYKDKKMEKTLGIVKSKNDKKESANVIKTLFKSKLCIQGVEKPGGNKYQQKTSGETKVLKTYARQKKNPNFKKSIHNSDNIKTISCNIDDSLVNHDLNNIDITKSLKKQVFCLCYDFGYLYDCDNSYEHIHFWHHNTCTDFETIISIYNDDDTIYTDRTLLNNDISEIPIHDTVVGNICWNYFSCDQNEACCKTLDSKEDVRDFGIVETKENEYQKRESKNVLNKTLNNDSKAPESVFLEDNAVTKDCSSEELQKKSNTTSNIIPENSILEADTNIHNNIMNQIPIKKNVLLTEVDTMDTVGRKEKEQTHHNESNSGKEGSSKKKSKENSDTHMKKDDDPRSKIYLSKEDSHKEINTIKDSTNEISKANSDTPVTKLAESEPSNKRPQKRSYSHRSSLEPTYTDNSEEPSLKTNIKCGVCSKFLSEANWEDHVVKHSHIAWRAGTSFNIDDPELLKKLENTLQVAGKLKCPCCYTQTKNMDKFMNHIKKCVALQDAIRLVTDKGKNKDNFSGEKSSIDSNMSIAESGLSSKNRYDSGRDSLEKVRAASSEEPATKNVKCGVCDELLPEEKWEHHVANEHCHIAWRAGATFNVNDPDLLKKLENTLEVSRKLKCPSCHTKTKHMKKFLKHIKKCLELMVSNDTSYRRKSYKKDTVKCGVCKRNVEYTSWAEHIGREHNYLAWIDDRQVLDLKDEAAVTNHLKTIIRNNGSLICYKCGLSRQRAQLYLDHIKTCHKTEANHDSTNKHMNLTSVQEDASSSDIKVLTCGVCKQQVRITKWVEHIGKEHHYLAWIEGSTPLNVDDDEAVWNHLKDFIRQNADGLVCYKCGLSRRRVKLYLSHIKTCDGEGINLEPEDVSMNKETCDKKDLICGVCNAIVYIKDWYEHIGKQHNYLAWTSDAIPLDLNDEEAVKEHLQLIIRKYEYLTCYKCGLIRKRAKLYLSHVENCDGDQSGVNVSTDNISMELESSVAMDTTIEQSSTMVTCAVCNKEVSSNKWIDHIGTEHQYIAWQQGETPLDVTDEEAVKLHLSNICKEKNGLTCNKCQIVKKYTKSYQNHITDCKGKPSTKDNKINIYEPGDDHFDVSEVTSETVTCGVCSKVVPTSDWIDHIHKEHNYIAWFVGKPPIDLNDSVMVLKHLIDVTRKLGELKCNKCDVVRRYAKKFLSHISTCNARVVTAGEVVCGVCTETVESKDWRNHAMNNHYNVAWIAGEPPIDINLPYVVEPYIKSYQTVHKRLVCKTCGATRVSAVGFYAHIITCGKTEEEMAPYKAFCDLCNNKYLLIYKNQHIAMHKEKENALERRLLLAKEKEIKQENFEPVEIVGGRRKAAVKANNVIEKYTRKTTNGAQCKACGFHSEIESEMSSHVCVDINHEDSGSDASIDFDSDSSDYDDSDVNSNISEEEREAQEQDLVKSKKHGDSKPRIQRLPYPIKNINSLMRRSAQHFAELHLTDEDLFTEWRKLEYEIVSEDELTKYMPPLDESCKVLYGEDNEWIVYKRFEANIRNGAYTLFTGACIQRICWVPSHVNDNFKGENQYLSVISHLDTDVPRQCWYDTLAPKPTLIQIWNCGNFMSTVPEFVMGIALDYGTIWAIDWCPSGSRDQLEPENLKEVQRLGLLAGACSNGSAYIFAVPYPSTIQESGYTFCKLKPIVELRLTMKSDRKKYPATAIKWATQKGHAHIIVGYGDGTTAYFDLKNESPLLRSEENDVTIIYPYYDERTQAMCIEDVDVFPSRNLSSGVGAVVSGSVGGVSLSTRPVGSAVIQAHSAAARVLFPPHWPAPLLAGDENLVSQAVNELEWYGGGRRLGGMDACCACAWCGRVAHTSPPLVKLLRVHPAYSDLHRQVIALLRMIPLDNKRKRKNDELSMIVEPLTYNDAIVKYGIEFKQITARKATQQQMSAISRDTYPERFPLANVTSMLFCPSSANHQKLALAVHGGLIFIINV